MASGVDPGAINSLSAKEAEILWFSWTQGAWGNFGMAQQNYITYCSIHNLQEVLIATNSKKGYRTKPPMKFEDYAPHLFNFAVGEIAKQPQLGLSAAEAAAKLGISLERPNATI